MISCTLAAYSRTGTPARILAPNAPGTRYAAESVTTGETTMRKTTEPRDAHA